MKLRVLSLFDEVTDRRARGWGGKGDRSRTGWLSRLFFCPFFFVSVRFKQRLWSCSLRGGVLCFSVSREQARLAFDKPCCANKKKTHARRGKHTREPRPACFYSSGWRLFFAVFRSTRSPCFVRCCEYEESLDVCLVWVCSVPLPPQKG